MFHMIRFRRTAAPVVALLAIAAAACDDPAEPRDPAAEVNAVQLSVGTQTVTVNKGGIVTNGPIALTVGPAVNVTAVWVRSNGTVVAGLEGEFELRIVPTNTAVVAFASTGTFTGTLQGLQAGTTTVAVQLFHLGEQHEDFEQNITVTVQ